MGLTVTDKTVVGKSVYDVRRDNLNLLIKTYGSIAKLNRLTGRPRTDSSLSQIRNQTFNTANQSARRMGSNLARTLERQLKLREGWFDTVHPEDAPIPIINVPYSEDNGHGQKTIKIPAVEKPEGDGVYISMNTTQEDYLTMGDRFLDKVRGAPAGSTDVDYSGLRFHEVESNSFTEIPRDTLVIVDTNIREFTGDGFYLIRVNVHDRLVKILQDYKGHFRIMTNDSFIEEVSSLDDVQIIGRAIYRWQGERM